MSHGINVHYLTRKKPCINQGIRVRASHSCTALGFHSGALILMRVAPTNRCLRQNKNKMDPSLQYWPKVGETVTYTAKPSSERFKIIEIKEEFPCAVYIIRSKLDGKIHRAHRHQLDLVEPPAAAEPLYEIVHRSNSKYTIKKEASTSHTSNTFTQV